MNNIILRKENEEDRITYVYNEIDKFLLDYYYHKIHRTSTDKLLEYYNYELICLIDSLSIDELYELEGYLIGRREGKIEKAMVKKVKDDVRALRLCRYGTL